MALVLTRRPGQKIVIGDDIVVEVHLVTGNRVKLLITAPREIPVNRGEVAERIKLERESK